MMIARKDVEAARQRIAALVHKTPLVHSTSLSRITGAEVYIKAENLQKTGSFKVRGAFNKMVRIGKGKVIAASMGNHAQAVAYAAATLGMGSKIVMPRTVAIAKEEATRGYGAEVELYGETFQEALDHAMAQKDYIFIHAFDDEEVIAGQGTIGLECLEELEDFDAILVPVGGGGLVAGIGIAVEGASHCVQVIGVQARSASSAYTSFHEGSIIPVAPVPSFADGIAVGRVGEKTLQIMTRCVNDVVLVSEESIAAAILLFMERQKFIVEGAGAVPLAALLEGKERFQGKKVVVVASGGNIDFTVMDRTIHKGLVSAGRIVVFEVTVYDVPGSLQALTAIIARSRGNILNVVHDRLQADLPVGKTRVIFTVETRTTGHLEEILEGIRSEGFEVRHRS